jgi:hypothetical protein
MVVDFEIKFYNIPSLKVQLNKTELAKKYYNLLKSQYLEDSNVIFRDKKYYTLDVLCELAKKANDCLGWDWDLSDLSLENLTILHKDIEYLVGDGYENLPAEYDDLVHDIHFALHSIQDNNERGSWLQLEWYNDSGFEITPEEYPAKRVCEVGDIKLQNPWVGHNPSMVYMQNDNTNIMQTCKFHDFVKPGINIILKQYGSDATYENYYEWFTKHCPEFIEKYTWETTKSFIGEPVVGKILNIEDLELAISNPYLEFEEIIFLK